MDPKFIHLRLHTEYSIKDGLLRIPALMKKAAANDMPAIALTDASNLYGVVKFYQGALKQGIKPIIGADLCLIRNDKQKSLSLLTVLCQNQHGYQNLLKLISKSFLEGQAQGIPTVSLDWLTDHSEGLIALSGGVDGDIGQAILNSDKTLAKQHLKQWHDIFGDRFYLEISRLGKANENQYIHQIAKLAESLQIPLVATNDVRFMSAEDFEAHEARVCIQQGQILADPKRSRTYTEQQYFRSQQEMLELFSDIPEALTNTVEIAKRCNVQFELGVNKLPHFPIPDGDTTESYLKKVSQQGLEERLALTFDTTASDFAEKRKPYDERLEQELDVINGMGFPGYFLIVADFTKWAKENNIPVGPGRGSGPGSLVAYSLKITDLDPIDLELLFERFLNPERVSMPDFDIDFCMEGRDRVIEYVMKTHGYDAVSQIITYGTMAAKAVVRDVGRVLGLSYGFVDKIAKLVPFELGMTLELAMQQEPMLQDRYDQEEDVKTLIDLALKLEGLARNVGRHAGGIVIAPGKLTDFVPLYCEPNEPNHPVTQFDKDDVEAVGLVKFDFLGLKTLTIIDRAIKLIHQREPDVNIDISLIELDDKKTFSLLKACQSTAVFQLESHGMRDLIKRLQPDCFEDLIALVALFRPGPLQSGMVDDFINRKHGRSRVVYPHPELEPILSPTYGVILYQEQVMQIAQVLAGYTLGAADILRRAMGKKKPEEMAKQREIFTNGAVGRGVDKDIATHIFDLMEKFAGYGFNKSHSASYALIAYRTAWLKAHYPAAFMAAVLSSDMDRTDKIILFLDDCKTQEIKVLPPDINKSYYDFRVIDNQHLRYGFGAIKGVGEAAIESMLIARDQHGEFKDLFDFCERIDLRKANKRVLEALIKSGSFDCFGKDRAILLASLPKALQHADQLQSNAANGQHDLLSIASAPSQPDYEDVPAWDEMQRLQGEKETLGFFLTGHPLNQYKDELEHFTTCSIRDLHPANHKTASIAAIITSFRTRQTKRGDRMGIFTLDDGTAHLDAVCFSDTFNKYRSLLVADQLVVAEGEVSHDDFNNGNRLTVRDIYTIDQAREKHIKAINITVESELKIDNTLFKELLTTHLGGKCAIIIQLYKNNVEAKIQLGNDWLVKPSESLIELLKKHISADIRLEY